MPNREEDDLRIDEDELNEELDNPEGESDRTYGVGARSEAGLGPNSAGQSGDIQGLSDLENEDSESVVELLEEGQYYEAEVVSGVENAAEAQGPVRTHEVPEDDVPEEYTHQDEPKVG